MPDDTLKAAEECRDCKAGATQARGMALGWRCMTHGVVSLNDYDRAIIARKDAEAAEALELATHEARSNGWDVGYHRGIADERARKDAEHAARSGSVDEYGLTEGERWETIWECFNDHIAGKHDWSAKDPYDCVVCSAVVALYRDVVRSGAQAELAALRAAAREVMKSYEAYVALGSEPGIDSAGSPPKPEDQWDEYDYMMIPAWRRLKAALDGAPWEPSEEQVERVAIAVWRERVNEGFADKTPPEQWVPPFTWESVHPHSKEVKYYPVARAALKAAMGSATSA